MARDTRISGGPSSATTTRRRVGHDGTPPDLKAVLAVLLGEERGAQGLPPESQLILCVDGASKVAGFFPSPRACFREMESPSLVDAHQTRALHSVQIVFCDALVPSIVHALVDMQPTLLVLTGDDDHPESRARLQRDVPSLSILGPQARLRVDPKGHGLHLGLYEAQLDELARCMGPARLALSPTPPWTPAWFGEPGEAICGWIHADTLDPDWLSCHDQCGQRLMMYAVPGAFEPPGASASSSDSSTATSPASSERHEQSLDTLLLDKTDLSDTSEPSLRRRESDHLPSRWSFGLQSLALARSFNAALGPAWIPGPEYFAELARQVAAQEELCEDSSLPTFPAPWLDLFYATLSALQEVAPQPTPVGLSPQSSPHVAGVAYAALRRRKAWDAVAQLSLAEPTPSLDSERAREVFTAAGPLLTDHESKVVFKGFGFEVTRQAIAQSASAALSYANKIAFPVALKAISPRLFDKSAAGCVALDLPNAAAVKRAYQQIHTRARKGVGNDQLDGILVSEMIAPGTDIQIRGVRAPDSAVVIMAAVLAPGQSRAPARDFVYGLLPHDKHDKAAALRFAERILAPALRLAPHSEQVASTAKLLRQKLAHCLLLLREFDQRLQAGPQRRIEQISRFDLHPLRILDDPKAAPIILDAYIEKSSALGW